MAYDRKKYLESRAWYTEFMQGRTCESCGTFVDLHWHHRDASQRVVRVGSIMMCKRERIEDELSRCALLCRPCHMLKHRAIGHKTRSDRALTDEQAAEIIALDRAARSAGTWITQASLAAQFGVSQSIISRILGGVYTARAETAGTEAGTRYTGRSYPEHDLPPSQ